MSLPSLKMIREKLWTLECKRGLTALPPTRPLGRQYPGALKGCGVKIVQRMSYFSSELLRMNCLMPPFHRGRWLVGKWIFHFRPISSDIGRTHFNLSRKYSAGTLLAGVWSVQPVGNPMVTRHWWDILIWTSSELIRVMADNDRKVTGHLSVAKQTDPSLVCGWQDDHRCDGGHLVGSSSLI